MGDNVSVLVKIKQTYLKQLRETSFPGLRNEVAENFVRMVHPESAEAGMNAVVWATARENEYRNLVHEQMAYYASLGKAFEWKYFELFQPASLKAILLEEGFTAAEPERLLGWQPGMPIPASSSHFTVVELQAEEAKEAMQLVDAAVYSETMDELYQMLVDQKQKKSNSVFFYAAQTKLGELAAIGRFEVHGAIGALFGGATLPQYRKQGAFTSLVATRLQHATGIGLELVTVDASPRSLPILQKLGFLDLGETIPFVFGG